MNDRLVLSPGERRDAVISLIRSAERRLVLSVFRCDDFPVLDELAAAVRRNVEVRTLITQRARGWKRRLKELAALLESTGAHVHRYSGPVQKYHAKYMVADDKVALIGSLNFTRKCFENTCDFMLITHQPDVVSSLNGLFDSDCHTPETPMTEISDSLIIGPDHSRACLTRLIENARESVHIIDHRVTDPAMIGLLQEKANGGIAVQVFGRGDVPPLESHGKMLVVDKAQAVIGSIALSSQSLDLRREVAVIVRDTEMISELNSFIAMLPVKDSAVYIAKAVEEVEEVDDEDEDDEEPI